MVLDEILVRAETLGGESADPYPNAVFTYFSLQTTDTVSVRIHDIGRQGNGVAMSSSDSNTGRNLGHLLSGEER